MEHLRPMFPRSNILENLFTILSSSFLMLPVTNSLLKIRYVRYWFGAYLTS